MQNTDPGSGARTRPADHRPRRIETPVFMPVGTVGSVKAVTFEQVWATGARLILGNTYHLYLRPGPRADRPARAGCTASRAGTAPC